MYIRDRIKDNQWFRNLAESEAYSPYHVTLYFQSCLIINCSSNFTIREIIYPTATSGDIAPGLSVTAIINFIAPSFADQDDFLTVVTDGNSFKVPLRARRDPPVISLVNPMDCLHSWIGDKVDMAFRCMNNGGDGGFKFFCEKDEDD